MDSKVTKQDLNQSPNSSKPPNPNNFNANDNSDQKSIITFYPKTSSDGNPSTACGITTRDSIKPPSTSKYSSTDLSLFATNHEAQHSTKRIRDRKDPSVLSSASQKSSTPVWKTILSSFTLHRRGTARKNKNKYKTTETQTTSVLLPQSSSLLSNSKPTNTPTSSILFQPKIAVNRDHVNAINSSKMLPASASFASGETIWPGSTSASESVSYPSTITNSYDQMQMNQPATNDERQLQRFSASLETTIDHLENAIESRRIVAEVPENMSTLQRILALLLEARAHFLSHPSTTINYSLFSQDPVVAPESRLQSDCNHLELLETNLSAKKSKEDQFQDQESNLHHSNALQLLEPNVSLKKSKEDQLQPLEDGESNPSQWNKLELLEVHVVAEKSSSADQLQPLDEELDTTGAISAEEDCKQVLEKNEEVIKAFTKVQGSIYKMEQLLKPVEMNDKVVEGDGKYNDINETQRQTFYQMEREIRTVIGQLLKESEEIKQIAILNGAREESRPLLSVEPTIADNEFINHLTAKNNERNLASNPTQDITMILNALLERMFDDGAHSEPNEINAASSVKKVPNCRVEEIAPSSTQEQNIVYFCTVLNGRAPTIGRTAGERSNAAAPPVYKTKKTARRLRLGCHNHKSKESLRGERTGAVDLHAYAHNSDPSISEKMRNEQLMANEKEERARDAKPSSGGVQASRKFVQSSPANHAPAKGFSRTARRSTDEETVLLDIKGRRSTASESNFTQLPQGGTDEGKPEIHLQLNDHVTAPLDIAFKEPTHRYVSDPELNRPDEIANIEQNVEQNRQLLSKSP